MTPKLLALLTSVTSGLGLVLWVPKAGVTKASLIDAGIAQVCTLHELRCTSRVDGGYREHTLAIGDCPRKNWIVPPALARAVEDYGLEDIRTQCHLVRGVSAGQFSGTIVRTTPSCACWRIDAGDCRQSDGGVKVRDAHNTFGADDWVGPGCIKTVCTETFGYPSRPSECAP